jgi:predicted kinase
VVDANFRMEDQRRMFLDSARRLGGQAIFLLCEAEPGLVRMRLANRDKDASDADWSVYEHAAETWEELGPETRSQMRKIKTGGPLELGISRTRSVLQHEGLCD